MRRWIAGTGILFGAALGLVTLVALTPLAAAQESVPVQDAPGQQDVAEWTVGLNEFVSDYPVGFTFNLEVSSTAGDIERARVEYRHREDNPSPGPEEFTRLEGAIDPERGVISAVWTPSVQEELPPWIEVWYRWRLRDSAGNEYVTDFAVAEYADNTREWERIENDDMLIFTTGLPEETAEVVLSVFESQRQKYLDHWGQALPFVPRVVLFPDLEVYQEWQAAGGYTAQGIVSVGLSNYAWGGTWQVFYGFVLEDLADVVLHEIEHLYQREFLNDRRIYPPGWWYEGDATFFELDIDYTAMANVQDWVSDGDLPVMLDGLGPSIIGQDSLQGYYFGYSFFKWLDQAYGVEVIRDWKELLAQDMDLTEALEAVTGRDAVELESQWRVWLGAPAEVPTLIPTWTPMFPVIASPVPPN